MRLFMLAVDSLHEHIVDEASNDTTSQSSLAPLTKHTGTFDISISSNSSSNNDVNSTFFV